jgi:hypothetical protein
LLSKFHPDALIQLSSLQMRDRLRLRVKFKDSTHDIQESGELFGRHPIPSIFEFMPIGVFPFHGMSSARVTEDECFDHFSEGFFHYLAYYLTVSLRMSE